MPKTISHENKGVYKDFDISFGNNPLTDDITTKLDLHAINQSLRNLVLTNRYERPFYPQIGCDLRQILFEPMDDITRRDLEDILSYTIKNFEPRVKLLDVIADPRPEQNSYRISVLYEVRATQVQAKFETVLKRLR